MSMNSSFIYGYGFPCDWTEEHFLAFIKNHKETFCQSKAEEKQYQELLECTENTDTQNEFDLDEFFDKYECETNGMQGMGAVVTNIMHRETGIGFFYGIADDTCDTKASVIFPEQLPWIFNDIERNLTQNQLEEICKTYCKELHIEEEPDFLSLEYFG